MPDNIPLMNLRQYWIYLLMEIFLELSGLIYDKLQKRIHGVLLRLSDVKQLFLIIV